MDIVPCDTCIIDGCDRDIFVKSRGWCRAHYKRWHRYGDPLYVTPPRPKRPVRKCSIDGCDEKHSAHGYCHRHAMQRRYWEKRDEIRAQQAEYRAANRERLAKLAADWRERNPGKSEAANRAWYAANKDRALEYRRQYRATHLQQVLAANDRRRAAKRGLRVIDLTPEQWEQIKTAWDHRCAYCGERVKLTKDHVIPISKGGDHTASNVVPACQSCNSRKGDRPAPPFYFQNIA